MTQFTPALFRGLTFALAAGSFAAGGTRPSNKVDLKLAVSQPFAVNLIQAVRPDVHKNILISPISAQSALAMLGPGLGQQDHAKLLKAFGRTANQPFATLTSQLKSKGVGLANSVWLAPNASVLPYYSRELRTKYGAESHQLTALGAAGARQINEWVNDRTKGRIRKLVGPLEAGFVLSLVNTVVFDGKWQLPFRKGDTALRDFQSPEGRAQVPTMHGDLHIQLRHGSDYVLGEFPYKANGLEMDVILPNRGIDPWAVLQEHRSSFIGSAPMPATSQQTDQVYLPKFNISTRLNLKPPMEQLGLGSFFKQLIDQKISSQPGLFISSAIQSVMVKVDEDGTKAAAATAISVSATAVMMPPKNPVIFNVDRPFAFVIRDTETGQCLFVGAIYNPQ